jgi:nucleotidyltransferase/DNA polymerase involved in DNA repair
MRILALWFPKLALELAFSGELERPLLASETALQHSRAVLRAHPLRHRAEAVIYTEELRENHQLSGGMQLSETSEEARVLGIMPGMTVAHARSRCSHLEVCMVHRKAIETRLQSYAEMALQFGATVSIDMQHDCLGVLVDITGCAHLFGGEAPLANRAMAMFAKHTVYAAVAEGPVLATLFARAFARSQPQSCTSQAARLLPTDPIQVRAALEPLPTELLLSKKSAALLARVGAHTLGGLMKLPRNGLQSRLASLEKNGDSLKILSILSGIDRTPLKPYTPVQLPHETCEFEYELCDSAQVVFLLRPLAERLLQRCSAQGRAVSELVLRLGAQSHPVLFPHPASSIEEILTVLKSKLESISLLTPIRTIALETVKLTAVHYTPTELFDRRASHAVGLVAAELMASLPAGCVGRLAVQDTWEFRERSKLVALGHGEQVLQEKKAVGDSLEGYLVEPTRILSNNETWSDGQWVRHVGRVEGHAWWRQRVQRYDYYVAYAKSDKSRSNDLELCWVEKRSHASARGALGVSGAVILGRMD